MSNKGTHYEQAFEAYLQHLAIPYVGVDQAKKAVFAGEEIKSFDFIVYPRHGRKVLVDVKGRKYPYRSFLRGRPGPTWTTLDDIEGLTAWENIFGSDYIATFVFAYWLVDDGQKNPQSGTGAYSQRHSQASSQAYSDEFTHNDRTYAFVVAELSAYSLRIRPRSQSWHTVYVPAKQFSQLAVPLKHFL